MNIPACISFQKGTRPLQWQYFMMFHYPNHVLRPSIFMMHGWPTPRQQNGSTYEMLFTVENVEIFKRRKNCKNWINYDKNAMNLIINKVGCIPQYYSQSTGVPVCTTVKQMKKMASNIVLDKDQGIAPPCKALEFMTFKYAELELEGSIYESVAGSDFWLSIVFPNRIFKVRYRN